MSAISSIGGCDPHALPSPTQLMTAHESDLEPSRSALREGAESGAPESDMWTLSARGAAVDRGLRVVLAQLELVSTAPTQRLDPGCGSGDDTSTGVWAPHERVRWRLAGVELGLRRRLDATEAIGDAWQRELRRQAAHLWRLEAREAILQAAQDDLEALTGRNGQPPAPRTAQLDEPGALQRMVVEEGEGWPVEDVARRFRLAEAFVRRLRMRAERDPDTGHPLDEGAAQEAQQDMAAREERCRQLWSEGKTQRQIAMLLGLHRTQVRRALGKAA